LLVCRLPVWFAFYVAIRFVLLDLLDTLLFCPLVTLRCPTDLPVTYLIWVGSFVGSLVYGLLRLPLICSLVYLLFV